MMDFGALFSQLISTYWWLLPLFVLAARLFLEKKDYHLIRNVTIPTEAGTQSEKRRIFILMNFLAISVVIFC